MYACAKIFAYLFPPCASAGKASITTNYLEGRITHSDTDKHNKFEVNAMEVVDLFFLRPKC